MIEIFLLPLLATLALASATDEAERARMSATIRAIGLGQRPRGSLEPLVPVVVWPDGAFLARVVFPIVYTLRGQPLTHRPSDRDTASFAYVRDGRISVVFLTRRTSESGSIRVVAADLVDETRLLSVDVVRLAIETAKLGAGFAERSPMLELMLSGILVADEVVDEIEAFRSGQTTGQTDLQTDLHPSHAIGRWRRAADRVRGALSSSWEDRLALEDTLTIEVYAIRALALGALRISLPQSGALGFKIHVMATLSTRPPEDDQQTVVLVTNTGVARPRIEVAERGILGSSLLDVLEGLGWLLPWRRAEIQAGEAAWRFPGELRPAYEMRKYLGGHEPQIDDPLGVFQVEARDHGLVAEDPLWTSTIDEMLERARR